MVTSYTEYESPRDLDRFQTESANGGKQMTLIHGPEFNVYSSQRPERNFISDEIVPLIFKNYFCFIMKWVGCVFHSHAQTNSFIVWFFSYFFSVVKKKTQKYKNFVHSSEDEEKKKLVTIVQSVKQKQLVNYWKLIVLFRRKGIVLPKSYYEKENL